MTLIISKKYGMWIRIEDIDPDYKKTLVTKKYLHDASNKIQEKLRTRPDGTVSSKGYKLTEQEYSNHSDNIVAKIKHMIENGGKIPK